MAHMLSVRDHIVKRGKNLDLSEIVQEMETILPWWHFVSSISEVSDRLTAVHAEVDALMVKTTLDAAKAGDAPALKVIFESSQSYDICRTRFDGAEMATVRLQDKLADAFSHVREQLAELDALLVGASDLNLEPVENALKTLVPSLVTATIFDASLLEKFSETSVVISARAKESLAGFETEISRVSDLMRWAERYDVLCQQLPGLEALGRGYLAPELRPMVSETCLKATETQAQRGSGIDLDIVGKATEEARKAFDSDASIAELVSDRMVSLADQLQQALIARMVDVDSDASAKSLSKCAKFADGALRAGSQGKVVGSLSDIVDGILPVIEHMKCIDAELAKTSGMNPSTILESLESLKDAWAPAAEVPELQTRIAAMSDTMKQRVVASFDKALAAENAEAKEHLLKYALESDGLFTECGLKSELHEALTARIEEQKLVEELPTLPTSSFAPPPRDSLPPTDTKLLAGAEWGADSPRHL
jgi:hypothetical protein